LTGFESTARAGIGNQRSASEVGGQKPEISKIQSLRATAKEKSISKDTDKKPWKGVV